MNRPKELSPEERADQLICEVEMAKAKIFPLPGNDNLPNFQFITKIDQDYLMVGNHVDEVTRQKIVRGEYIDFGKLLSKDRILTEEDGRMELIMKNGRTYWSPISDAVTINGFARWEQAFRIYSNIYTSEHPQKSGELIQYNHIIHSISLSYVWENMYAYDKEFRIHISKHPEHSWAVILQQAWSMKLRDRISHSEGGHFSSRFNGSSSGGKNKSNEPCKKYNKGKEPVVDTITNVHTVTSLVILY